MTKKKAVIFFISFFGVVILITALIGRFCKECSIKGDDYSIWIAKQAMVELLEDRKDTIILGDSSALNAFIPNEIGDHVYNFATRSGSPVRAYYFLKYMVGKSKRPKNIIMSFTDNHYGYIDNSLWDVELGYRSDVITKSDVQEIINIDKSNSKKQISPFLESETSVRIPIYYNVAYGPINQVMPDFNNYLALIQAHKKKINDVIESRGYVSFGDKPATYKNTYYETPLHIIDDSDTIIKNYIEKIVALSKSEGINIYIIHPPVGRKFYIKNKLVFDKNNIFFSKYETVDTRFLSPILLDDDLLHDTSHIFNEGAIEFSRKVKSLLVDLQ